MLFDIMAVLSLRTADGREATTGNASAVRRLGGALQHGFTGSGLLLPFAFFFVSLMTSLFCPENVVRTKRVNLSNQTATVATT